MCERVLDLRVTWSDLLLNLGKKQGTCYAIAVRKEPGRQELFQGVRNLLSSGDNWDAQVPRLRDRRDVCSGGEGEGAEDSWFLM